MLDVPAMMTNTAALLSSNSMMTHKSTETSASTPPPSPPPPPVRARTRGMVRPVIRRRAPAVPPATDDPMNDMFELDPVQQNEQNDVIWQRRVDCDRVVASTARPEQDGHRRHRPRRRPSPHPPREGCRQCRLVEETRLADLAPSRPRQSHFVDLKPSVSRADNEYVDEPSTTTADATQSDGTAKPPGVPLKELELTDSSTSLRAAVTDGGVMCKACGGCRCASCQRTVLLCTCRAGPSDRGRCGGLRTVIGVCVPCLCSCWLWTASSCRRHCTNKPEVCRCRADSL